MKRNFKNVLLILLCFMTIFTFVGCGVKVPSSPKDVIENEYGDTQFKISFDSSSLEEPLRDVFYSAKNMPVLPTPKKVGFVFAGWYFNSSLTEPCNVSDGDLYWKMKNLTLYPKWEEEKIVNNGTYEIEFNAEIVGKVTPGPLAKGYQKFPEDIIKSETYIEKNDKGTFLRIQYDNRVRGPVLGSSGADENNFSKMTYTVTDADNRIDKDISILDRTNNIQTLYYNIDGLKLTDTIKLSIEYYNWVINIDDNDRDKASVLYEVEFNITKFIGFNQAFINPEGKLEDGVYVVPTHYASLDKSQSMLDMFNPVYAHIVAQNGKYTLYKSLNAYNNDTPTLTPEGYPLRNTGYAREFACMRIDKNKIISNKVEQDKTGLYYLPELIGEDSYVPLTYEFHADTGRYYYSIDLGNTLENDLVFIGGSAGAMEQMFSRGVDYRRLNIDYNSIVRVVDFDYEPFSGAGYTYSDKVAFYPGQNSDFNENNTDIDIYKNYRQAINMTNVFFSRTAYGKKIYDTKVTIALDNNYRHKPSEMRNIYGIFNMEMTAYGYDPSSDGDLYARELSFITNNSERYTNSSINKKINGKTLNIGDRVSVEDLFKEKVVSFTDPKYTYKAFLINDDLTVDFNNYTTVADNFTFEKNIAISYSFNGNQTGLVCLVKKEKPVLKIDGWNDENSDGVYETNKRYNINEYVKLPEIKYSCYGEEFSLSKLSKEDQGDYYTDFTKLSVWEYSQGIYKSSPILVGMAVDFQMKSEKVRVLAQLVNQFEEFDCVMLELKGKSSGEFQIKENEEILVAGDIKYKGDKRIPLKYEIHTTLNINQETDLNKIPASYNLFLNTDEGSVKKDLVFSHAMIYTKTYTDKVFDINSIWNIIKNEDYAFVVVFFTNEETGDIVIYKAQYNFKLDGQIIDNYYFINTNNKTIFNDSTFTVRSPLLMSNSLKGLSTGGLKILGKAQNSNDYIDIKDEQVQIISQDKYSATFKFNEYGSYLLCWHFILTVDFNDNEIFDINKDKNYETVNEFNVCQQIVVENKYSDVELTYATDKAHPFDTTKQNELEQRGYVFTSDENYYYATKNITRDSKEVALTSEYFVFAKGKELLFTWLDNDINGKIALRPGHVVRNVGYDLNNLHPTIYAMWDKGVNINFSTNIDDKVEFVGNINIKHSPFDDMAYLLNLDELYSRIITLIPKGYSIYGWQADKAIFHETITTEHGSNIVYSTFKEYKANESIYISRDTKITAIIKKRANIIYEAVDNQNNKLKFIDKLEKDYDYMNDKLIDALDDKKFEQINKPIVDGKKFKHWKAFDKTKGTAGEWVIIDINTFVLEDKYADNYGNITLRAVFG